MLKKLLFLFVALFSNELINVTGELSQQKYNSMSAAIKDDCFSFSKRLKFINPVRTGFELSQDIKPEDNVEVKMKTMCDPNWRNLGNICDILDESGTDDKTIAKKTIVKMFGIDELACPISKGEFITKAEFYYAEVSDREVYPLVFENCEDSVVGYRSQIALYLQLA